ncbi:MAG TPA: (2Fe-2S)-binding protein [Candidatus Atribacteria bacterium]|nr:(2Fe-2S)-binding protein [Candidatus Atribacteria bacterium]
MKKIQFTINGEHRECEIRGDERLIDLIREDLGLTGTKEGCGQGECGACTVLLDGVPIVSCLTLAIKVDKREITTIEGVSKEGHLHPVQEALIEKGAVQCGFCTPGMVMSLIPFLSKNENPTREEVRRAIEGNLCRCTGYEKIIDAALYADEKMRGGRNEY